MASAELSTQETPVTPWWLILIEGVALILVGLLLLSQTGMTSIILVQVLGVYWLLMGIVRIVSIFIDSAQWGWKLFAGVLAIIAGVIVVRHPVWSTVLVANTVIIILGLTGIIIGAISLFQAFRGAGWGTGILGVFGILLGIVLLANVWILSFSLPLTIGVLSIIGGILSIYNAFRARREEKAASAMAGPVRTPGPLAETPVVEPQEVAGESAPETSAVEQAAADAPAIQEPVAEEPDTTAAVAETPAAPEPPAEEAPALDHHALQLIEGIGPAYAEKLAAAGVNSTESLLERGATPQGRTALAGETSISGKLILTWVNHADLMRVKGVGSQFADLLEEAGVDTIPDLARRNATNLHETIVAVNEEKKLVRHLPSQTEVASWIASAKELPRIVQY
jgi:uncharacterized membrane protein HdeD (DUF308 family)/predicted flap endonuclease-1-like 5' DNA nuclease